MTSPAEVAGGGSRERTWPSIWPWTWERAAWLKLSDLLAVAAAAALPWSTSALAILAVLWALSLIPSFERAAFLRVFKHPASVLPVLLFALGVAAMLWAEVPWSDRIRAVHSVAKLLFIPLLFFHFARSQRAWWPLVAFLASCAVLMIYSWFIYLAPHLALAPPRSPGVPIKDYINQSQEFVLCAFAGLGAAWRLHRAELRWQAVLLALLAAGFLANVFFVALARTALIYIPALLLLFAVRHFKGRLIALTLAGAAVAGALVWSASPMLRGRALNVMSEYEKYRSTNAATSTGQRLEYWRKSLRFVAEAPLIGHGTGSIKALYEVAARGQSGVSAEVVSNPHNQTLRVAVQFGLVGVAVLYAMWFSHAWMFRGHRLAAWIGLVVVVQNFISSIFNSHLFDFHEGWIYVLGAGIAGGMMNRAGYAEKASLLRLRDLPRTD
ncbi:MAG: O-antigen ligase domain-containing protein [Xanthobacteraceae bacterium]|nr:MAG: O-antigen ligase domain-containing protein [Xanthobacteraceae bacterium]